LNGKPEERKRTAVQAAIAPQIKPSTVDSGRFCREDPEAEVITASTHAKRVLVVVVSVNFKKSSRVLIGAT
jgi:hypothetical protein